MLLFLCVNLSFWPYLLGQLERDKAGGGGREMTGGGGGVLPGAGLE